MLYYRGSRFLRPRFGAASKLSVIAVLLGFALPNGITAQERSPVVEGARVRVSATEFGGKWCTGTLVEWSTDTLTVNCWRTVERSWEEAEFPLSSITSVEVSRGRKSNVGKGALIGGLIGAGAGLAIGLSTANVVEEATTIDEEASITIWSAVALGLVGAGVGVLIGSASTGDRWEKVPLDRLKVSIVPTQGAVVLAFSMTL